MITRIRTSQFAIFLATTMLLCFSMPAHATATPRLCNVQPILNYGNLKSGETKVLPVIFKNCGTANLIVFSARTFNGWSTVGQTPIAAAPGAATFINVTVADSALRTTFPGLYTDRLILTTNGGNGVTILIVSHVYGYHNINDTTTIAGLHNRVDTLNAQISTDTTSIAVLKAQETNDTTDIAELHNHIDVLNAQISANNASIAILQSQLATLQTQLATPVQGMSQLPINACPGSDSNYPCITVTGYNPIDGYVHVDDTTRVSDGWISPRLQFTIYPYTGATYGVTPTCTVSYNYPQNAGNATGGVASFSLPVAPGTATVDQPLGSLARDVRQHVLATIVCSGANMNKTFSLDYKWFPS
jgi:hypothetical protein